MILSNQYRILYRRIATLTDDRIIGIFNRYHILIPDDPDSQKQAISNMRQIEKYFQTHVDSRLSDLLSEWVVKLTQSRMVPWNFQKYGEAAKFYKSIYAPGPDQETRFRRIQKFQEAVTEHNDEFGKRINPKNILDFSIEDFDDIQGYYHSDPKVDQLQEELPNGARLIYNDGTFQIVETTTVEAVCYYGQKSRWCTRKPGAAEAYLESGPIYVIFKNGKRYAQYHLSAEGLIVEPELVNPKHKDIEPDDTIRKLLLKSGLITSYLEYLDSHELDSEEDFDEYLLAKWMRWVGMDRIPEIEHIITPGSMLDSLYRTYNLKQRQTAGVPHD